MLVSREGGCFLAPRSWNKWMRFEVLFVAVVVFLLTNLYNYRPRFWRYHQSYACPFGWSTNFAECAQQRNSWRRSCQSPVLHEANNNGGRGCHAWHRKCASHPSKTTPGHPVSVASHLSFEEEETDDMRQRLDWKKCFPKETGKCSTWQISPKFCNTSAHNNPPSLEFDPRDSPQERYSPGSEPSFARFATKSDTWYQTSTMRLCSSG